jgi:hypothetical protein
MYVSIYRTFDKAFGPTLHALPAEYADLLICLAAKNTLRIAKRVIVFLLPRNLQNFCVKSITGSPLLAFSDQRIVKINNEII